MLRRLLDFGRRGPHRPLGYIYVQDNEAGPLRDARPGGIVRLEGRGPPWIVVNSALSSVIVAKWPGQLWKARIIEAAAQSDQPYGYAGYTRCISVEIIEQMSPAMLFGDHGQVVVEILRKAAALTHEQAVRLSSVRHAEAPAAYDRVFRRWINESGNFDHGTTNYDGTLSAGPLEAGGSPISGGLALIDRTVLDQARSVDGAKALLHEEDGTPYLDQPWAGASRVLRDAALALGAPQLSSSEDRHILLAGLAAS